MPTQPTTRAQISGYNFLVRRMEHAIVRRDVRMLFDPMRSQSRAFSVGVILAALVLAGCGVLALIRPQDKIGENKILVGKDTGAMYVVLGDTVHPVLNLASARLAVGQAASPAIVKSTELEKRPRGQLIGIPGAPPSLPFDPTGNGRAWTVCDRVPSGAGDPKVSVIVGEPKMTGDITKLTDNQALLLKSSSGSAYLVYNGQRAKIDLSEKNKAVIVALGLTPGQQPREVSDGLLNAIPEVRAISAPKIDGTGGTPNFQTSVPLPSDAKVGWILVSQNDTKNYVVLSDGLLPIQAPTAEMILNTINTGQGQAERVAPSVVLNAPQSASPLADAVSTYPTKQMEVRDASDAPVGCLSWKPLGTAADRKQNTNSPTAELSVLAGRTLPVDSSAKPVPLIQAGNSTSGSSGTADRAKIADEVYIKPGTGIYTLTTGSEPTSQAHFNTFFVGDTGVRFGIDTTPAGNGGGGQGSQQANAVNALGFGSGTPEPAPDPIVALLAQGPTLSRKAAMVAHEGVQGDTNAATVPAGGSSGN